jgi:hypothetical protein
VVCLDHGLRTPNGAAAYNIVPAEEWLEDRPAVVELLKGFGRGELNHNAVQAAAWHLNSDQSWDQLATKLQGARRNLNRSPYFSADEIRAGMAYANESRRLAEVNAEHYSKLKKERAEKLAKAKAEASHARSATDAEVPAEKKDADSKEQTSAAVIDK